MGGSLRDLTADFAARIRRHVLRVVRFVPAQRWAAGVLIATGAHQAGNPHPQHGRYGRRGGSYGAMVVIPKKAVDGLRTKIVEGSLASLTMVSRAVESRVTVSVGEDEGETLTKAGVVENL